MAKEKKRFMVFRDGTEKEITRQDGKYYYSGDAAYRILSDSIVEIREEKKAPASKKKAEEPKEEVVAEEEEPFAGEFDNIPDVSDLMDEMVTVE